ncbi:uncharacterized protein LOC143284073 [Babylonia areolata]|uniref:uncharacterized protein LOC143284073 n=1 Tax=Babylonia areolata TaxID=304850 RepID=UPI003FD0B475
MSRRETLRPRRERAAAVVAPGDPHGGSSRGGGGGRRRRRYQGGPPSQEPEPGPELEPGVVAVRQQLQAKVSGSLRSRGVNAADRWQAKPKGQMTTEEYRRLERQRENKKRWARKERERSKSELEYLRKTNNCLSFKKQELQHQINKLQKWEYRMRMCLSDHECKLTATAPTVVNVVIIPPSERRKMKYKMSGRETTQCGLSHQHFLGSTLGGTPSQPTSGKGKGHSSPKTAGWKRIDHPDFLNHNEGLASPPTSSSLYPHSLLCIESILKSASTAVGAAATVSVNVNAQGIASSGAALNGVLSDDGKATADTGNCSQSHVPQQTTQQHFPEVEDGVTEQTLQSEKLYMIEETDNELPEDITMLLSVISSETDFDASVTGNSTPLTNDTLYQDFDAWEHYHTDTAGSSVERLSGQDMTCGPEVSNASFLPSDQMTPAITAAKYLDISSNTVSSDERPINTDSGPESDSLIAVPVEMMTGADRISASIVNASVGPVVSKRSMSWETRRSRKRSRCSSLSVSHQIDTIADDITIISDHVNIGEDDQNGILWTEVNTDEALGKSLMDILSSV